MGQLDDIPQATEEVNSKGQTILKFHDPKTQRSSQYVIDREAVIYERRRGGKRRVVLYKAYYYNPETQTPDITHPLTIKLFMQPDAFRRQEADTQKLCDKHATTFYQTDTTGKKTYSIVYSFHEGETLENYLRIPRSLKTNLTLACQMMFTMQWLHRATPQKSTIVHSDIKPDNLIVNPERETLDLVDYGHATPLKSETDFKESYVGTPNYMAPEIVKDQTVTNKADIYASAPVVMSLLGASDPCKRKNAFKREEWLKCCPHGKRLTPEEQQKAFTHWLMTVYGEKKRLLRLEEAASKIPFDTEGILPEDPLEVKPIVLTFLDRMQHADYHKRPSADESLIFFNTLLLLVKTSEIDPKDPSLLIRRAKLILLSQNLWCLSTLPLCEQFSTYAPSKSLVTVCKMIINYCFTGVPSPMFRSIISNEKALEQIEKYSKILGISYSSSEIKRLITAVYIDHLTDTKEQRKFLFSYRQKDREAIIRYLGQMTESETTKRFIDEHKKDQEHFNAFREAYLANVQKSPWFVRLWSSHMREKLRKGQITTFSQILFYVNDNPNSRSAKVYAAIGPDFNAQEPSEKVKPINRHCSS